MSESRLTGGQTDEENNMLPLKTYLSRTRSLVFPKNTTSKNGEKIVLVMGNPSADLDSLISAVTTSYFYDLKSNSNQSNSRTYIPILNLPSVRSSDLWRLRPEFGVALR